MILTNGRREAVVRLQLQVDGFEGRYRLIQIGVQASSVEAALESKGAIRNLVRKHATSCASASAATVQAQTRVPIFRLIFT